MDSKGQGRQNAARAGAAAAPGRQVWWLGFALLSLLGLLLVFGGVVHVAVRQGVTMREAAAAHAAATWRCNFLPSQGARVDCLQQLAATPSSETRLLAESP
jgi:hypothetical protein